jgi:hypothetical protein
MVSGGGAAWRGGVINGGREQWRQNFITNRILIITNRSQIITNTVL